MSCISLSFIFAPLLRSCSAESSDNSDSSSILNSAILETTTPICLNEKLPEKHIQWLQSDEAIDGGQIAFERKNSFLSSFSLRSKCDCSSLSSGSFNEFDWEEPFEDRYSSLRRIQYPIKDSSLQRIAAVKIEK
mmetsp:Transcript_25579/g.37784  ORF Transcript_25579/g.37784 Transcript_25579/m.37784 type:complete len:134 (-) Transcript_25579:112-513(-)